MGRWKIETAKSACCLLALALASATLNGCDGGAGALPANAPPILLRSLTSITYNTSIATLSAQGSLVTSDAISLTVVRFYADNLCATPSIGEGTSATFSGAGISLKVSSTQPTTIYGKTNTDTFCYLITNYQPTHLAPPPASFISTNPPSPSRSSYSPVIFGTVSTTTAQVLLFDDAACSHQVGSGPGAGFSAVGIPATLTPNQTSSVYAKTVEPFGNASACTPLCSFTHQIITPASPTLTGVAPPSPNNSSVTPTLTGKLSSDSITVSIYSDAACTTQLATGSKTDFEGAGIQVTVAANTATNLYAQAADSAGDPTICAYLTTYVNDTTPPAPPSFSMLNPSTPTRLTIYPLVVGLSPPDTATVRLFNSASCANPIGSGTKLQFETTGIRASTVANATTTIYAETLDVAGNPSTCTHLVDFTNDTIPPDPPSFTTTNPISPNNKSTTPLVTGTTSPDTVFVKLFNDSLCTSLIGAGSDVQYNGAGILVTATANATTQIYGQSFDNVGNPSPCTLMTSYAHSNQPSAVPVFVSTVPTSPSRASTKPWIQGTAVNTISKIQLYSDNACSAQIGQGSRSSYISVGIQATVPANAVTSVYAMATDIYGNQSSCVLLTQYTHDNVAPLNPTFVATLPASPNNQSLTPLVQGSAPSNPASILPVTTLSLYDSPICVNRIGQGTPAAFAGAGIQVTVPPDVASSIYAMSSDAAGNTSLCTFMAGYTYDDRNPGKPVFVSATPASPSYSPLTVIVGSIGSNTDILPATNVAIFSDAGCTSQLTTGAKGLFTTAGIPVTVPTNVTTTLYGITTNVVGNASACTHLTDFREADLGPAGIATQQNPNGSVGLSWTPDAVAQPSPTYIVKRAIWTGGPYTVVASPVFGSSFNDTSVSNSATYYYVVAATNSTGTSHDSAEVQITIAVGASQAPTNLTATPGAGQVALSWSSQNVDMTYSLYRGTQAGGPYTRIAKDLIANNYTDSSVTNGTPYYYVATGSNPAGESAASAEASAVPLTTPGAPSGLVLALENPSPSCAGGVAVHLTWSAPSYFNQFNVKIGTAPGSEQTVATVAGSSYVSCNPSLWNNIQATYYVVTATWGLSESLPSNEVSFSSSVPVNVATLPGNTSGSLSWNAATNAIDYSVLRSTVSGGPYSLIASGVVGSSYADSGLTNGTSYYYVVIADYGSGLFGFPSAEASLTPGPNPAAPSNLQIAPLGNQPGLTWTAPANYNGFNIYRAAALAGPYNLVSVTTTNSFTDSLAPVGRSYYKVTAVWGSFETAATNIASYRNGVPGGVAATSGATAVTLNWGSVASATSYTVKRATTAGGPYGTTFTTTALTYADSSVTVGTGYFYVVSATFGDGTQSQNSNQVSGMAGASKVPSSLTVTAVTATSATLQWAAVSSATSYKVYVSLVTGGPYSYSGTSVTSPSATLAGLTTNKKYYYTVTSIVSGVESAKSAEILATPEASPSAPIASPGNGTIDLTWAPVGSAVSYNVLRSTNAVTFAAIATGLATTSYTDPAATNGQIYFYEITAVFATSSLTSPSSPAVTPGITPLAPGGLTVMANTTGTSITLDWGAVPGSTSYNFYVNTVSGGPYGAPNSSTSSVGNVAAGLVAGTTYYIVVTALNGSMVSAYSPELAVIPAATPPSPTAIAGTTGVVNLSWPAVAGAINYDIQRTSDGVTFATIATGVIPHAYADSALPLASPYAYRYLPRGTAGVPMALSAVSPFVTPGVQPVAPTALLADATAPTAIKLSWVTSPSVVSYNIYRGGTSGGPYSLIGNVPNPTNAYSDSTVTAGNSYFYVLTAVNASGVESPYSNEVNIKLVTAPSGLTATASDNQIQLSWSALGGASSYLVKRANASAGPYGVIASGVATPSYTDTAGLQAGLTYYYVVAGVQASGVITPDSAVASATAIVTVNLQVPVELADAGLASGTTPVTFERAKTSFDPSFYDGVVTYFFEIVATNTDSVGRAVTVVDSTATPVATITVPAGTTAPTRLRSTLSPNVGEDYYRVSLAATTAVGNLQVYSSRLLVNQSGATRTRLYYPLLASSLPPSANDGTAPIETTVAANYAELPSATIYSRKTTSLASLAAFNAWNLETVTATTGGAAGAVVLHDITQGADVADTETLFSSNTPGLNDSPFDDGVNDFGLTNELDQYEISVLCASGCTTGGTVELYKAGLWVTLNPLTQAEVLYRDALGTAGASASTTLDSERSLIDLSLFSNPSTFFQAVAQLPGGGSAVVKLMDAGAAESGLAGLTTVTGSNLNFSPGNKVWARTAGPVTLTSGHRFLPQLTPTGGTASLISSSIVIDVTH